MTSFPPSTAAAPAAAADGTSLLRDVIAGAGGAIHGLFGAANGRGFADPATSVELPAGAAASSAAAASAPDAVATGFLAMEWPQQGISNRAAYKEAEVPRSELETLLAAERARLNIASFRTAGVRKEKSQVWLKRTEYKCQHADKPRPAKPMAERQRACRPTPTQRLDCMYRFTVYEPSEDSPSVTIRWFEEAHVPLCVQARQLGPQYRSPEALDRLKAIVRQMPSASTQIIIGAYQQPYVEEVMEEQGYAAPADVLAFWDEHPEEFPRDADVCEKDVYNARAALQDDTYKMSQDEATSVKKWADRNHRLVLRHQEQTPGQVSGTIFFPRSLCFVDAPSCRDTHSLSRDVLAAVRARVRNGADAEQAQGCGRWCHVAC